jgi:phage terminase small subunit
MTRRVKHPKLTRKEELFVAEFLIDGVAAHAADRAGYGTTKGSSKELGYRLMQKPLVRAAIDTARAARVARTQVDADRTILELALIAYTDSDIPNPHPTSDRVRALALLGKHQGLFTDRLEVSGPNGGPIPIDAAALRQRLADRLAGLASAPVVPANGNGRRA